LPLAGFRHVAKVLIIEKLIEKNVVKRNIIIAETMDNRRLKTEGYSKRISFYNKIRGVSTIGYGVLRNMRTGEIEKRKVRGRET
jgi:hypothetical protein